MLCLKAIIYDQNRRMNKKCNIQYFLQEVVYQQKTYLSIYKYFLKIFNMSDNKRQHKPNYFWTYPQTILNYLKSFNGFEYFKPTKIPTSHSLNTQTSSKRALKACCLSLSQSYVLKDFGCLTLKFINAPVETNMHRTAGLKWGQLY